MTNALLVPTEGPLQTIELDGTLEQLQRLVGGYVEAVPLPAFIADAARATAYINEEGKFLESCAYNARATDFMVPGIGVFLGDYIAGPMLLCGFDPRTGEHIDVPEGVVRRARLIEREA